MHDRIIAASVKGLVGLLNKLPVKARLSILNNLAKIYTSVSGQARWVAMRNLELAFPNMLQSAREKIYTESLSSLARVFVDLARLPQIDRAWCETHVEKTDMSLIEDLRREFPGKGLIYATGHLGSFELLASYRALIDRPLAFIAREIRQPALNTWWNKQREFHGNEVIARTGALRGAIAALKQGKDLGILFDQNVTRNHAVFVNWFGRPAATTKLSALCALRFESPILLVSLVSIGEDKYKFIFKPLDCRDIYASASMPVEEKITHITQLISDQYTEFIRAYPGQWFWIHRRWRTTPEGMPEDFYLRA